MSLVTVSKETTKDKNVYFGRIREGAFYICSFYLDSPRFRSIFKDIEQKVTLVSAS